MTEPRAPRLSVDIVSDVMCPWCIIGWLKFRKVIDHFAGRLDFRVQWHPFELNPDMPAEGEDAARERAITMCRTLLANPVTEDFDVEVVETAGAAR